MLMIFFEPPHDFGRQNFHAPSGCHEINLTGFGQVQSADFGRVVIAGDADKRQFGFGGQYIRSERLPNANARPALISHQCGATMSASKPCGSAMATMARHRVRSGRGTGI